MGPNEKGIIEYEENLDPNKTGVYACRIEDVNGFPFPVDKFLMWSENKWFYCGSDQECRTKVFGWIGPLVRTKY